MTAILALRLLDHDRDIGFGRGVHVLGAVLITSALMLLVYTIVKPAAESGWASGRTLALLAFVIAAGLVLAAIAVAVTVLQGEARGTQQLGGTDRVTAEPRYSEAG